MKNKTLTPSVARTFLLVQNKKLTPSFARPFRLVQNKMLTPSVARTFRLVQNKMLTPSVTRAYEQNKPLVCKRFFPGSAGILPAPLRIVFALVSLLLASGLTSLAIAGNGPTKDQELFVEYKKTHSNQTALVEKYSKAMHCLDHGKYKTSIKLLKELSKEDPKWPGIWVSMGTANLWIEDYPAGIECNTKAISLRPKDADIYRRRALHYIALFKYKEALADLDQAFKLEPTDFDILKLRASCNKALKKYPAAIADYDRMLKKYPNYEEVLHDKSRAYWEIKDWKNALLTLDVLIKYYPNDETSLLDRASTRIHLQDYKGAVQDYTKVISIGAEAPDYVFSQRAMAYEKLGMKKEAARDRARVKAN